MRVFQERSSKTNVGVLIPFLLLFCLSLPLSGFTTTPNINKLSSSENNIAENLFTNTASSPGETSTGVLNNSSSVTFSHTIHSGFNRLLVVGVSAQLSTASVNTVTYNGLSLTRLGIYPNTGFVTRVEIWYLVAPPTGTYDVVLNNSTNDHAIIGAQTFYGVDPTTPFGSPTSNSGTGGAAVVSIEGTISSSTDDQIFGIVAFNNGDTDLTTLYGQRESWDETVNSSIAGAAGILSGGTGINIGWSATLADRSFAAVAIRSSGDEICSNASDDNGDGRTDEVFPGGVQANMQLWLKGEAGTNTTTEGQNITSWADQSVNALFGRCRCKCNGFSNLH